MLLTADSGHEAQPGELPAAPSILPELYQCALEAAALANPGMNVTLFIRGEAPPLAQRFPHDNPGLRWLASLPNVHIRWTGTDRAFFERAAGSLPAWWRDGAWRWPARRTRWRASSISADGFSGESTQASDLRWRAQQPLAHEQFCAAAIERISPHVGEVGWRRQQRRSNSVRGASVQLSGVAFAASSCACCEASINRCSLCLFSRCI